MNPPTAAAMNSVVFEGELNDPCEAWFVLVEELLWLAVIVTVSAG